ncbi:MAG TPA: hypothetical protein VKT82_10995 [Ktedonobacterales bacterium]|nr:hypothetical protein [Ktedonobacterales bacterium]
MSRPMPTPESSQPPAYNRRPPLVTFAAMMLILLFGLQAVVAILEFVRGTWLLFSPVSVPGGYLWIWGIVDVFIALIPLYAAYDILRGGEVGRIIGLVIAIVSAIRWFFYLPLAPIAALIIIGIDVVIIYALVAHSEYFESRRMGTPF